MNPLASIGGGVSASSGAKTGDSSSGLDLSWNYNAPFQVGGSGRQTQDAGLTATPSGIADPTLLYVVGGVGALLALGFIVYALRK